MEILTAHSLLAQRTDRSAFDFDVTLEGYDIWPAAATAAVMLSGALDDALTDEDLDAALEHFGYLARDGIVTDQTFRETTGEVIERVVNNGLEAERIAHLN